jgi:glycosyltransferase involved in cell wall biosynthesis
MSSRISLIVPTRGRPHQLRRFLDSLVATAHDPANLEVVLVIDSDDPDSSRAASHGLTVKHVIVPPGLTMGALNMAGYEASTGDVITLLNDDVVARTPGWDAAFRKCFAAFADGILLIHFNDTIFQKALCTFPVVSRRFCELAGGICPRDYRRYRIDDHIEDIFNLLGLLGERRSLYLEDVIFEHLNYVTNEHGVRQYFAEETTLAIDARLFDELADERKKLTLRLKNSLAQAASARQRASWQAKLAAVQNHFALRRPERLRVVMSAELARPSGISRHEPWMNGFRQRWARCVERWGYAGLARATARRILRSLTSLRP